SQVLVPATTRCRGFLAIGVICALLPAAAQAARLGFTPAPSASHERVMTVFATAYNATRKQTDARPHVGAWGDRLDQLPEGTRAIAVSPDLAGQGLRHH